MEEQKPDRDKELEELKQKCEEYLAGWQRARADFLNYQKDEAKRFTEIVRFANEALIRELILILDSLELALAHGNKEAAIIQSQMEGLLKNHGFEKLSVVPGKMFDPREQEAAQSVESDQPSGTILEVMEKGYTLNGKVIRSAKVRVAK